MIITVTGRPIAKQANKISSRGGFIKQYSSQSKIEKQYIKIIKEQCQNHTPFTGALRVDYEFIAARPKSHFGSGKNSHILKKSAPLHWIVKRNDFDNMLKFVNDRCSGLVWHDDCQIITGYFEKRYCRHNEKPKTILNISQI